MVARFGTTLALYDDGIIERMQGEGRGRHPVAGVTAVVESGEALSRRVTVTRLVGLGVFAFAAKKKSGGESYLVVEGPDFGWVVEVDWKRRGEAVAFAARVRGAAAGQVPVG